MNKDLHHIDDLFLSALDDHEETPSAAVKQGLDAALDRKDAEEYKKRFLLWKRAALLLLLLLAGFVLYESGLIKTGGRNYTAKKTTPGISNIPSDKKAPVTQTGNAVFQHSIIATRSDEEPKKQADRDDLQTSIPRPAILDKKISSVRFTEGLIKNISLLPPRVMGNHLLAIPNKNISTNKKTNSFKPFWSVSPFVSYEETGYKLDSDDPLTATVIRHREVHEPSFSGGILATRQFTGHWSLQSGLAYTSTQIGISPQKMYALQLPGGDIAYKFITSSGYAYVKLGRGQPPAVGDSITTSDAKHLLKHISVPFLVKYKIGKNKLTISPAAGVEANFITNAKVEVGIDLASNREIITVNKLEGIKSFYWSVITGVEASCQVNKKLSINVQPVFRYALSPITKNNVVETFPYSFGIKGGITIRF